MVGTVSYMPPKQAMGGEVTGRADLYSLGAMLYEMVCGCPPFLGDDSVAIIGQHINTPPVAPTWHRLDCPRPLEALIMRLLAKDPAGRPASASDVLTALGGIDLSAAVEERAEEETPSLDSLAGGVFVGRADDIRGDPVRDGHDLHCMEWRAGLGCVTDEFVTRPIRYTNLGVCLCSR